MTPIQSPSNIIFDDDIILINSNNVQCSQNEKSNFENKIDSTETIKVEKKELNNIPILDIQNIYSNLDSNVKSLDNIILDDLVSKSTENLNIISGDKNSNRYNKKLNNIPDENDLMHIRNYDIINNDNYDKYDKTVINNNNIQTLQKNKDLDSKIFNKSNKLQKLFKDSKTISGRFTKDSIIKDYKDELDYYEKLRTPWWESDAKYDYL